MKSVKPFKYQKEILNELSDKDNAIIHVASGGGKTNIAAFEVLRRKPKSFIYIVHRNEILYQSLKAFKQICPFINDDNIGVINQIFKEYYKPYLFATIQTLAAKENVYKVSPNTELVIIDEAHHMAAPTYRKIIKHFNQAKQFRGLTATPFRMDQQNILKIAEKQTDLVGNIDILEGIKKGILCTFDYVGIWDNVDYSDIEFNGYKYKSNDLDKKLLIDERDKLVISEYNEKIEPEKRQTIGFCATINHLKRMVQKFREAGISVDGVYHRQEIRQKARVLEKFRNGEIQVMFAVDILNEGVDFPECEALMFLRPTHSEVIFRQQLGRGLRKKRGKKNVLVLDFIGNYKKAWHVQNYLKKITQGKPVILEPGKYYKPEFRIRMSNYALDSRVVEMMEMQEKLERQYYTNEQLIQNYLNVKKILNRIPTSTEINDRKISCISVSAYATHFGTWVNFKKHIEGTKSIHRERKYNDEQLRINYQNVEDVVKGFPRAIDLDNKKISFIGKSSYVKRFGNLRNAAYHYGNGKIFKNCEICNNPFERYKKHSMKHERRTCYSSSCQRKLLRRMKSYGPFLHVCHFCDQEYATIFIGKSIYCSEKCEERSSSFRQAQKIKRLKNNASGKI